MVQANISWISAIILLVFLNPNLSKVNPEKGRITPKMRQLAFPITRDRKWSSNPCLAPITLKLYMIQ